MSFESVVGQTDTDGWLGWMAALPSLGEIEPDVVLARPTRTDPGDVLPPVMRSPGSREDPNTLGLVFLRLEPPGSTDRSLATPTRETSACRRALRTLSSPGGILSPRWRGTWNARCPPRNRPTFSSRAYRVPPCRAAGRSRRCAAGAHDDHAARSEGPSIKAWQTSSPRPRRRRHRPPAARGEAARFSGSSVPTSRSSSPATRLSSLSTLARKFDDVSLMPHDGGPRRAAWLEAS